MEAQRKHSSNLRFCVSHFEPRCWEGSRYWFGTPLEETVGVFVRRLQIKNTNFISRGCVGRFIGSRKCVGSGTYVRSRKHIALCSTSLIENIFFRSSSALKEFFRFFFLPNRRAFQLGSTEKVRLGCSQSEIRHGAGSANALPSLTAPFPV